MNIIDVTDKIPMGNYSKGRDGYIIDSIVFHITGDSEVGKSVNWFMNPKSKVSSHFVIEKDGTTIMCVDPLNKAYHAGVINGATAKIYLDKVPLNPNQYTIGIECVSSGEPLTTEQQKSLFDLINYLCPKHNIKMDRYHMTGHYEYDAVDRPFDPIKSYSVDDIVKKLNTGLDWKQIIDKVLDSPTRWENAINTAVSAAKAQGDLGALEVFEFLPALIEKVYNSK